MRRLLILCSLPLVLGLLGAARAQGKASPDEKAAEKAERGVKLGPPEVKRWQIGMVITADGGPLAALTGTTTVPMDWPEQKVKIVARDLSPGVTIGFKPLNGAVTQMIVKFPPVAAEKEVRAVVTFEITRRTLLPPDDTDVYVLPDPKKLKTSFKDYLSPSPYIESNHPQIKDLAKRIGTDKEKAWDRVKAIYDWVRLKIQYQKDSPLTGVVKALEQGTGDCNQLTSAFVAICRAGGIPARTVRLPTHCYPEFYLLDDQGQGHWFPCEASGDEAFGGILHRVPIMQKGDNFRLSMPNQTGRGTHVETFRFLPENLVGLPRPNGGQPRMKLVCKPVEDVKESEE